MQRIIIKHKFQVRINLPATCSSGELLAPTPSSDLTRQELKSFLPSAKFSLLHPWCRVFTKNNPPISVRSTPKLPNTDFFSICNFSKMKGKHHKIKLVYSSALKNPKPSNEVGHRCLSLFGLHVGSDTTRNASSKSFFLPKSINVCTKTDTYFLNTQSANICMVS